MTRPNKSGTVKSDIPSLSYRKKITPELMEQSRAEVERLIKVHGTKELLCMITRSLRLRHHQLRLRKERENADVYWRSADVLSRITSDHPVWP